MENYINLPIKPQIMETNNPIIAKTIIEIVGAPKEHIENTIKEYVKKLKEEGELEVLKEEYVEAKPQGELFSTFVELELKATNISHLAWFCFDYMPSSIEIVEPSELIYKTTDLTDFLNDLQGKLHKLDLLLKNLSAENKVVKQNGLILTKNSIMLTLKDGSKPLNEISKLIGMPEEHVKKFVNVMVKENRLKETEGKYSL